MTATPTIDPGSAPRLRVEEICTLASFVAKRAAWDDLCSRAAECYPMLTHDWLCAWWTAFASRLEVHVLLVWRDEVLVGAAPLVLQRERVFGLRRRVLSFFANSWVDRFQFLLVGPEQEIVDALLTHMREQIPYDLLNLFPLDDASPQSSLLLQRLRIHHYVGVDPYLQSPYLRMPANWEQLQQELSTSFRQSMRRKVRKVDAMPDVKMNVMTDASCFAAIETVSLESWQHDEGTSMVSTPSIREFYSSIVNAAARAGTLRCAVMEVRGEPAAFEFNLMHRGTIHNFKLGFRKKYAELSTGIVLKAFLLEQVLREAATPRLLEYDFMGTTEPYKLNWTKNVRTHSRFWAFRRSWHMAPIYWLEFIAKPWLGTKLPWLLAGLRKTKNILR